MTRNDSAGTTTFVYDADGQLAVAYGGAGAATGTTWLTDDQLGSTRVVTDAGGSVVSRLDYLPFGEEISGTVRNARSGVVGYSSDGGVKVQFTGKERDGLKSAARKRVGDPASAPLTIKQETASEIISVLRQEELKRKRLETQQ